MRALFNAHNAAGTIFAFGGLFLYLCCVPAGDRAAYAQQAGDEKSEIDRINEEIRKSAASYRMFLPSDLETPLEVMPIMRWANNVRGSADGVTFIWLGNGVPVATACIYPWQGRISDCLTSLSRMRPRAEKNGRVVWYPSTPGIEFQSIPNATLPAKSKAARLSQMKMLARQFSSTMTGWNREKSDVEKLRQMPQPVYRYKSKDPTILDGAIFAFVTGTDPESLLLIEAYGEEDSFEWQFGFARKTSGGLTGSHRDKLVWEVPKVLSPDLGPTTTMYIIEN